MLIKVKVFSNAKKQKLIKKSKDNFEIQVKSKPLQGQANKEAIKVLAEYFEVPKSKVRIINGFRHTNKIFSVSENLDNKL
ncbi:MAG: DUF167 domain-containing protein [Candidatus Pacebacteria bacterium]|jgi:hypothetical protein|nr:DUF167 domain-containing protein [Candidatus Paceibacterota bacterium]MDD4994364.1 DUF167 domain-containing protein [Candidatus Paceibacterota bacterium]MDD5535069.1 DUF167 domain-containing protein [Candidatus Paceibacterota bacterium]